MKKSFTTALQTAYVSALNGNLEYDGVAVPVTDGIYQGSARNYVLIGNITEVPSDTMDSWGKEVIIDLHIFTKQVGQATKSIANDIANQILGIIFPGGVGIDGIPDIADFQVLNVRQGTSNFVEEPGPDVNIVRMILPIEQTVIQQ